MNKISKSENQTPNETPNDDRIDFPIGIAYGDFDNGKITTSSQYNKDHSFLGCKLNKIRPDSVSAWCSSSDDENPWIQVIFPYKLKINAVSIQGRGDGNYN